MVFISFSYKRILEFRYEALIIVACGLKTEVRTTFQGVPS